MSTLLERMKGAGSIKMANVLSKSEFFADKDQTQTKFPILNIALSGKLDGGLTSGLTILAGPSKHFKSLAGLVLVQAYMEKHKDAICLFYDSEFGITPEYISANGIDTNRVLHIPIEHIEQLKFDISKRLDEVKRGDKVIIFMDSVGNLASKKEVEDAMNGNSAADMTRAKQLKSLFRIITPHFTTKDLPCIVVNHTYMEQGMYPKAIMSGGTGPMYSADTVIIFGKSQEKDGTDLAGWTFTMNIEKSRRVKEKSKLPFTVMFEGGIQKWSGMLDIAMELGYVKKPSNGWYSRVDPETGEIEDKKFREKDTHTGEFWKPLFINKKFHEAIAARFMIANGALITDESIDEELEGVE
jgi:RecA/RadA recombinase